MPLSHVHKVFAVEDAKITPITADAAGAVTTYGTAIDIAGIQSVEISGNIESKTLRGDNTLLDGDAVLTEITGKLNYAKLSLDVLAAMFTSLTVADSGTAPNQKTTLALTPTTSRLKAFKFEAKTPTGGVDVSTGDLHIVLYKCVLSAFPDLGMAEEDYQTGTLEFMAMPTLGTGNKWLDVVVNETAAVIS
jgi:hypothetical protein